MSTPMFRKLRKAFRGAGHKLEVSHPAEMVKKVLKKTEKAVEKVAKKAEPVVVPAVEEATETLVETEAPEVAPAVLPLVQKALDRLEAGDDDLTDNFTRAELEHIAVNFGVENPESLANKGEISRSIVEKHRG